MTSIPGMIVSTRVSAVAQYTQHLVNYGESNVSAMRTTFIMESKEDGDLDTFNGHLENIVAMFNGRLLVGMDNPFYLSLLEPKNGHTLQTFLAETKKHVEERAIRNGGIGYAQIGDDVPTSTKSGIKLFVTKQEPTLEYLAAIVLKALPWATHARATTDTGMSATVSWDAEPVLL